jgi:N-acetylneuraminic acid mutarotase
LLAVGLIVASSGDAGPGSPWQAAQSAGIERTEVGAARIGDSVYVVGGYRAPDGTVTGALERYDSGSDTWEQLRSLPIEVNHPAVTAAGGKLYLNGGFRGDGEPTDRLFRYSPGGDRWKRLPDSPVTRAAHALQAIGGKLYAAGGSDGDNAQIRKLAIYDISSGRWTLGPSMQVGRNHVASAALERKLYVIGGRPGPEHGNRRTVERYNAGARRWRRLAPLDTATSGASATAAAGKVVVFGGEKLDGSGETIAATESFNPGTGEWTSLPDMRTPRHGLGGVARGNRVYAIEGGPRPGLAFSSAIEFLDVPRR